MNYDKLSISLLTLASDIKEYYIETGMRVSPEVQRWIGELKDIANEIDQAGWDSDDRDITWD